MVTLKDFIECLDMCLDINIVFENVAYYIGYPDGRLVMIETPDGKEVEFDNSDELLNYKINGNTLRNSFHLVTEFSAA
ncbi:MAG: hypothetical protein LBS41_06640 [Streptococcaceae bacterium]|jgi:hypothetical protein|nr:hypothetical protein [Streptococcaceae bacterium]